MIRHLFNAVKKCEIPLLPLLVIPVFLLFFFTKFCWHAIEEDIAERTLEQLKQHDQAWLKVETRNRGRQVLLIGNTDSSELISIAKKVKGVQSVSFLKQETSRLSAFVQFTMTGNTVNIAGKLNRPSQIANVIHSAKSLSKYSVNSQGLLFSNVEDMQFDPNIISIIRLLQEGQALTLISNQLVIGGKTIHNKQSLSLLHKIHQFIQKNSAFDLIDKTKISNFNINLTSCQRQINRVLSKSRITFDTASSTLKQTNVTLLNTLAEILMTCPMFMIEIGGHTDSSGDEMRNLQLSTQRAEAVKQFFVRKKLDANRIITTGYGSLKPKVNQTDSKSKFHRRVEIQLKHSLSNINKTGEE